MGTASGHIHPVSIAAILLSMLYISGQGAVQGQSAQKRSEVDPIREEANQKYRGSSELLNGEKYYYPYRSARGTPFLELPGDPPATVQLSGKTFHDQRIRYDIYNQYMILDYENIAGVRGSLVLNNAWIDQVTIGKYRFRLFPGKEGKEKFGQVIGEGGYTCIYFWEKQYLPSMKEGELHYFFSGATRRSFLKHGERLCSFKGNRSLMKCFPESYRSRVKRYLKANRLRVKKADTEEMEEFLHFLNQQDSDG